MGHCGRFLALLAGMIAVIAVLIGVVYLVSLLAGAIGYWVVVALVAIGGVACLWHASK